MIILKKPIVTEKTLDNYKKYNKVSFEVILATDKIQAAKALAEAYSVTVEKSWVTNRLGKKRQSRTSRKLVRKSSDKKIMTFQLKKGDKINIFEGK
jgi:ribosomal protein L23